MAVSYGSQSNTGWATVNDVTVTKPTGLAVGDLMFFWLATAGNNVNISNLSGWTYIGYQGIIGALANASYLAYKYADSGDVAAANFTWNDIDGGTAVAFGAIIRVTGATNVGSLIVASATDTNKVANTAAPTFTGITPPARGDSLLLQFWNAATNIGSIGSYAIATSNPSWTEALDVTSGSNICASVAYASRPEVTATGNFSCAGGDATTDWNGWVVAVPPAWIVSQLDTATISEATVKQDLTYNKTDTTTITDTVTTDNPKWTNQNNSADAAWTTQEKST